MKAIRHILSDRVLATAMAVVIAYMVVLQSLAGSYAQAATISPAENPFHVICAGSSVSDTTSGSDHGPLTKSVECPCALFCRLAGSAAPAILAGFAAILRIATVADTPTTPGGDGRAPSSERRLLAEARAPPKSA